MIAEVSGCSCLTTTYHPTTMLNNEGTGLSFRSDMLNVYFRQSKENNNTVTVLCIKKESLYERLGHCHLSD